MGVAPPPLQVRLARLCPWLPLQLVVTGQEDCYLVLPQRVRVSVERQGDGRVPGKRLHHLWTHLRMRKQCQERVAQAVEVHESTDRANRRRRAQAHANTCKGTRNRPDCARKIGKTPAHRQWARERPPKPGLNRPEGRAKSRPGQPATTPAPRRVRLIASMEFSRQAPRAPNRPPGAIAWKATRRLQSWCCASNSSGCSLFNNEAD